MMLSVRFAFGLAALLPAVVAGCNGSQFKVVPAEGVVLCNGAPVTSGSISFNPISADNSLESGKPASASLGPDGRFVLSTYDRFDGAIVGKHQVVYVGGEDEDSEESEGVSDEDLAASGGKGVKKQATSKNDCVQKGEIVVEVVSSGKNDFTIELSGAK
jgi:hypothetical protein